MKHDIRPISYSLFSHLSSRYLTLIMKLLLSLLPFVCTFEHKGLYQYTIHIWKVCFVCKTWKRLYKEQILAGYYWESFPNRIWSTSECQQIDYFGSVDIGWCQQQCLQRQPECSCLIWGRTVEHGADCSLRACPVPNPLPKDQRTYLDGYCWRKGGKLSSHIPLTL